MLLLANHSDEKVMIEGELIECKRGQSVKSLKSWAKQFKWSIQQIRTFFKILQNDKMITLEGMRKTTRVTICNYDYYQKEQQTDNTEITRRKHPDNTEKTSNKNEENAKNEKNEKEIFKSEVFSFPEYSAEMLTDFYNYWSEADKKGKMRWQKQPTWETNLRLSTWNKRNNKTLKPVKSW
ncbi:MAG: hypothetical protein WC998_07850 [Candidatus Paceibacterota bacterium]|jgi:DNA replication protein DnaD